MDKLNLLELKELYTLRTESMMLDEFKEKIRRIDTLQLFDLNFLDIMDIEKREYNIYIRLVEEIYKNLDAFTDDMIYLMNTKNISDDNFPIIELKKCFADIKNRIDCQKLNHKLYKELSVNKDKKKDKI